MAQLARPDADAAVRAYLLADAIEFRALMVNTLLDDGPESAKYAWVECSKAVDRLSSGAEHRVHRWQLPDSHPARAVGSIYDDLILGADDVLRPA